CTAQTNKKMNDAYAMAVIPEPAEGQEVAVLASGCFWGTEYYLQKVPGVTATTCGYTGGVVKNPTYREVCTKRTGHYEAVHVVFDPEQVSFEELARVFFETHDPTQRDGQGPDIGPQYRSAVFFQNEAQREVAQKLKDLLIAKGYDVATEILPAAEFYSAENYHQDYYDNKGGTPYCHAPRKLF
ncbi:MAG: peptide-methionine (S)-S-oxide reductase MsrA, partial [Schleiferiaceae bacterium]